MNVALGLADRVARTAGPRAGLAAYRVVAGNADGELRGRALLAGLRCARTLGDAAAIDDLVTRWPSVSAGLFAREVGALCKTLPLAQALQLARAEAERLPTALALYLFARCLDVAEDPDAAAAFARAIGAAEREGAAEVASASRVRRCVLLAASFSTLGVALDEGAKLDLAKLSRQNQIAVARVLVCSPSRFVRAGAIPFLDLAECARFVEERGRAITPLEADRVAATFPEARAVLGTAAALSERAHDILAGRFDPVRESTDEPYALVLDVAAALRDGEARRAVAALMKLEQREVRLRWSPPIAWTIGEVALGADDADVRAAAARLVTARLERGACAPPPRGWISLARALANAGEVAASTTAQRAAVVAREPGAVEMLSLTLTRSGWEHARRGERTLAVARLREAKALSVFPGAPTRSG